MAVEQPSSDPVVEATSVEFLGRWNRLVSTTNWEKGRILCQWREAMIAAGAPPTSYSDEAWSRRVGNVTPQHTGRLRRVYQRFHPVREIYPGLYWSHFQVALDWDDAEMWLEGARHNGWSIAQMQNERSSTLGTLAAESAACAEGVGGEALDEDAPGQSWPSETIPVVDAAVRGTDDLHAAHSLPEPDESAEAAGLDPGVAPRPFEHLGDLPCDLRAALEAFKLAILHHKLCGWQEVACADVLMALDGLRQLALAPAE
jgi:hypothetical protein